MQSSVYSMTSNCVHFRGPKIQKPNDGLAKSREFRFGKPYRLRIDPRPHVRDDLEIDERVVSCCSCWHTLYTRQLYDILLQTHICTGWTNDCEPFSFILRSSACARDSASRARGRRRAWHTPRARRDRRRSL